MKELSVEEKAKAYDGALERMKSWARGEHPECFTEAQKAAEFIFPELKENEDERIRKAQLDYWRSVGGKEWHGVPVQETIAWLEKQGEHAKFSDSIQVGDKVTRNQDGVLVNLSQLKRAAKPAEVQGEQKPVEPQQNMLSQEKYAKAVDECIYGEQKPAWSEEDEETLKDIITSMTNLKDSATSDALRWIYDSKINWLESLKGRYTWKPSDEQMGVIEAVINNRSFQRRHLDSLYADLKKLRKE